MDLANCNGKDIKLGEERLLPQYKLNDLKLLFDVPRACTVSARSVMRAPAVNVLAASQYNLPPRSRLIRKVLEMRQREGEIYI